MLASQVRFSFGPFSAACLAPEACIHRLAGLIPISAASCSDFGPALYQGTALAGPQRRPKMNPGFSPGGLHPPARRPIPISSASCSDFGPALYQGTALAGPQRRPKMNPGFSPGGLHPKILSTPRPVEK
jgi:hypothetical protein